MQYPYYGYPGYQPYVSQPAPDQLQQLRQPYQQIQMQPQLQPQSGAKSDERIWVQGKEAALSYLVAPNSFVRLWDSLSPIFYEKSADATGRPTMETFEYKRKAADEPSAEISGNNPTTDYRKEIDALTGRIKALEDAMKESGTHDE